MRDGSEIFCTIQKTDANKFFDNYLEFRTNDVTTIDSIIFSVKGLKNSCMIDYCEIKSFITK